MTQPAPNEDVRDTLIDCIASFYIHGDKAAEIADYILSESSGLRVEERP